MKNVILETERLILRKPTENDFEDIQEGIDNIKIAKCITSMPHPYTLDMVKKYFGKQIRKWDDDEPTDILFAIELKSEEKVIGIMGIHDIDRKNGTANTGSWINEKYWNHKYITEAKVSANTFVFNSLELNKLTSNVFTDNIASNATQKKLGYDYVGTTKELHNCLATGKKHRANVYELTKAKWNLVLSIMRDVN